MNWEKHCKDCKKNVHCCRFSEGNGFVFVDIKTAEKIRQKIGKDYSAFLDYSPLQKGMIMAMKTEGDYLEGSMRLGLLDDEGRILRLKIKDEKCIFLGDDGKCEIYDVRPNICRIYPLWAMRLIGGNLKVIRHDENPLCEIVQELQRGLGDDTDMEKVLPKEKIKEVKGIWQDIEKENEFYKKNIKNFAAGNNLK